MDFIILIITALNVKILIVKHVIVQDIAYLVTNKGINLIIVIHVKMEFKTKQIKNVILLIKVIQQINYKEK